MPPTRRTSRPPVRSSACRPGCTARVARMLVLLVAFCPSLLHAPASRASNFVVFSQLDDPDDPPAGSLRSAVEQLNAQADEESFIFFELGNPQAVLLQDALDDLERNVELVSDRFFTTQVRAADPDADPPFEILRVSKGTTVLDGVVFSGGPYRVGIDPVEGADAVLVFRYGEGLVVDVKDDIHGLGGLSKEGAGDLFLSGINDFEGMLEIVEGRVVVDEEGLPGDADVAEGATLRFDKFDSNLEGEDELTPESYAGLVTGDGLVQKAGPHDLVLDPAARFDQTGGTEVLQGRLVAEPASVPGDVAISQGAFLQLDVDAMSTSWAGSATGDGTLEKTGNGLLVLDGQSRNRGGLDVQEGFVQGAAANLPSGLELATGTRVFFEQPVDATYAGRISGDGGVTKQGAGTLTLSASNDWLGGTTINDGRLRGPVAAIPGDVALAAAGSLEFFEQGTATYTGQLTGAGSLVKSGAGTLVLPTSQPGFAGGTRVEAGTLELRNAALLPGALTIDAGAEARGEGVVNGLTDVQGRLRPGGGVGTVFLAQGGAVLGASSELDVQVQYDGGVGDQSRLEVNGATTLDGGGVRVDVLPGDYATPRSFSVLTSTDGITQNAPLSVTPAYAFVDVVASVVPGAGPGANPQDVRVTVTENGAGAVAYAQTTNQAQVAVALDAMLTPGNGTPAVADVRRSLVSVTAEQVPEVLDQMSAASLSDLLTQRLEAGHRFTRAVSRRFTAGRFEDSPPKPKRTAPAPVRVTAPPEPGSPPEPAAPSSPESDAAPPPDPDAADAPGAATARAPLPAVSAPRGPLRDPTGSVGGWGLWFDAFGVFGRIDGGSETDDVKTRLYGGSVGLDYRNADGQWLPKGQQLRLGAAFDYARAAPFGDAGTTQSRADLYQVAGHASWTRGRFYAGTVGLYGFADASSQRWIDFGDIDEIASGDFDGQGGGVYAEAGARFGFAKRMVLQPWVGFEWVRLSQSAYTERGAPALGLEVGAVEIDSLQSQIGARWSALLDLGSRYGMEPELRLGWAHEFGDVARVVDARFTGALTGGDFSSIGAQSTRDEVLLGAGYTMRVAPLTAIALDYDARVGTQQQSHAVTASLYVQW